MRVSSMPTEIGGGAYERAECIDVSDHAGRNGEGPKQPGRARKNGARQRKRSQSMRAYVHKMSARCKVHRNAKSMPRYLAHFCPWPREPIFLMPRAQF